MPKLTLNKGVKHPIIPSDKVDEIAKKILIKKFPFEPIHEVKVFYDEFYQIHPKDLHKCPKTLSITIKGVDPKDSIWIAPRSKEGPVFQAAGYFAHSMVFKRYLEELLERLHSKILAKFIAEEKRIQNETT